jgi:hypothetical protein
VVLLAGGFEDCEERAEEGVEGMGLLGGHTGCHLP